MPNKLRSGFSCEQSSACLLPLSVGSWLQRVAVVISELQDSDELCVSLDAHDLVPHVARAHIRELVHEHELGSLHQLVQGAVFKQGLGGKR